MSIERNTHTIKPLLKSKILTERMSARDYFRFRRNYYLQKAPLKEDGEGWKRW